MTSLPDDARRALAVGWATVELDRAASELAGLLVAGSGFLEAPSSALLGARCRVGLAAREPGLRIMLLEPETEGLLAATLARNGEGWVATWAPSPTGGPPSEPAGAPGLSAPRPGPLGDERLVLGGPHTGPHRLLVDAVPSPP